MQGLLLAVVFPNCSSPLRRRSRNASERLAYPRCVMKPLTSATRSSSIVTVRRSKEPVDRVADPNAASVRIGASPLLVRTKGAETGVRTKIIPGLDSSLSVFMLDQDPEIVFEGDAGDTSASRASQRYGLEWTNRYRPISWLDIDADFAYSHARFVGFDSEQEAVYQSLAG